MSEAERIVLDCRGLSCPIPVTRLARTASTAPEGTVIELLSDDEGSRVDIPVWCRMRGQEFLGREDRDHGWAFLVRTRAQP